MLYDIMYILLFPNANLRNYFVTPNFIRDKIPQFHFLSHFLAFPHPYS